jgi:hypothetical protein
MKKHLLVGLAVGAFLVCGTIAISAKGGHQGQEASDKQQRCLEKFHFARHGRGKWTATHCVFCPPGECNRHGGKFAKNGWRCSPANCRHH